MSVFLEIAASHNLQLQEKAILLARFTDEECQGEQYFRMVGWENGDLDDELLRVLMAEMIEKLIMSGFSVTHGDYENFDWDTEPIGVYAPVLAGSDIINGFNGLLGGTA